jgi:hypothetical protein
MIKKFYIEKLYPLVISLALTVTVFCTNCFEKKLPELVSQLSDNAISISVTLIGFLLTILTILNSIDTRRMRFLKDMGGYPILMKYLKTSIQLSVILIGFSFIVKYVEHRNGALAVTWGSRNLIDYIYIFFFLYTMLASFRFTTLFVSLLTDKEPKKEADTKE